MANIERLRQLQRHLESGQLGHEHFDLRTYHCGASGCAIGECPTIWPEAWEFRELANEVSYPVLKGSTVIDPEVSGAVWFGLSDRDYARLFLPLGATDVVGVSGQLPCTATRHDVAAHIGRYIDEQLADAQDPLVSMGYEPAVR